MCSAYPEVYKRIRLFYFFFLVQISGYLHTCGKEKETTQASQNVPMNQSGQAMFILSIFSFEMLDEVILILKLFSSYTLVTL